MATAWIIEWHLHRPNLPIHDLRPHILPRHWWADRVLDYMRCLFWNSGIWTPFETLARVNKREPLGIFIQNQGQRLIYGDATHLIAWRTKDLQIKRNGSGKVVMEWTAPAGKHYDSKTDTFHPLGKSHRRRFVLSE